MWKNQKVSVVMGTYNEKESIRAHINGLFKTNYVDEVIVINNNAVKGTSEEVKKTKAIEIKESKQGFGYAYLRAYKESTGDIIIATEPDGTFEPNDILKLLSYSDSYPVVFGTRTVNSILIGKTNMTSFYKWGNILMARFIRLIFQTQLLTDTGCTFRLIKKSVRDKIIPHIQQPDYNLNPEMMLLIIKHKIPFIEVPITYKQRIGNSFYTEKIYKVIFRGIKRLSMVIKYRFRRIK